jgi:hypothetical protein
LCDTIRREGNGWIRRSIVESIIYHGNNVEVAEPRILQNGCYKDFGYGFYCNKNEKQAKRWALTRTGKSVVNRYSYSENTDLKRMAFPKMNDEWLDFVADCRNGILHDYDIVEGPMADDQIRNFVEDLFEERFTRAAFWEIVKCNHPTHQIVFLHRESLENHTFRRM